MEAEVDDLMKKCRDKREAGEARNKTDKSDADFDITYLKPKLICLVNKDLFIPKDFESFLDILLLEESKD